MPNSHYVPMLTLRKFADKICVFNVQTGEYKEEVLRLKDELKESYETNKLSNQDIEQYKSLLSIKDIELLNLDEQNKLLQTQISVLKDIKISSME